MRERARDFAILLGVCMILTLPNLGAPSLWDLDEGVNAQTSREMQLTDTWVIPTFNYQLRTAKPVMLYWLQRFSYAAFGTSEWSARLPSVLAAWLAVLLTYELARQMFNRGAGLLAGVVLASVAQFAILAHAATPDATLLTFTILAYLLFWIGHSNGGRWWWPAMAAANALAFLTKGPIGLVLPMTVASLYFLWNRELGRMFDRRAVLGGVVFVLIAGPWYGLVTSETRGEWIRVFISRENVERFVSVMDKHQGSVGYYFVIVPIMFAPWSAFLLPLFWYGVAGSRRAAPPPAATNPEPHPGELTTSIRANRFLLCWIFAYFAFFSAAATKLPNYLLPIYPAMAILAARYLTAWRDGELPVARWMIAATVGGMTAVGAICIAGLFAASLIFPGLKWWAAVGLIPLATAGCMWVYWRREQRQGLVRGVAIASVLFIGVVVGYPALVLEPYKAPKELARMSGVANPDRDLRVGQFEWPLPSMVYYAQRQVDAIPSPDAVAQYLAIPTPAYVFMAENTWNNVVSTRVTVPHRVVGRHYDFLHRGDIVIITNEMANVTADNR
jgi:4-amino-4-deoxy-L-arabinose transferase-like glycosyltransferase